MKQPDLLDVELSVVADDLDYRVGKNVYRLGTCLYSLLR